MSLLDALLLDPYRINVWIAYRTDGIAGNGTQTDPYDGSTIAKFDTLMNGIAANTCVHLGPGEFQTAGYYDGITGTYWQAKAGMRIVGSGIDVTTLKLVNTTATTQRVYAVAHELSSPTPLVTAMSSFGSLRNDDSGWVGFRFQVGAVPLTVTALGRWIVSGNSGSHTVQLFNMDGTQVPGGSVTLNTAGQTAGQFAYVTLATPVTLHMDPCDIGYDIVTLLRRYHLEGHADVSGPDFSLHQALDDEQLNRLYNLFDAMVLPSTGEGFGLPIIESFAAGVPVVATNYSACSELVRGRGELVRILTTVTLGTNLLEHAVIDVEDLAARIEKLYRQPDLAKQYSDAGLEFARSLRWETLVPQWLQVISSAAGVEISP